MSRAVVFDAYGDANVLRVVDVDARAPEAGQVRVAVEAAGVQPFDCLFRSGAAQQWYRPTSRNGSETSSRASSTRSGTA